MAIAAPPQPARLASVQKTTEGASAVVVTRRGRGGGNQNYLATYQDWQDDARRYARTNSAVRFTGSVKADVCARCTLQVEQRNPDSDEWVPTEDQAFVGIFDRYRNPRQTEAPELVRAHAWHYAIAGEGLMVSSDGPEGAEWSIFSRAVAEWDRPTKGQVTLKLTPDGKLDNETAFAVPRDQAVRFWIPDEEWQALATSSLAATIEDLRRYMTLGRYTTTTVESQMIMNGLMWAPAEAFEDEEDDTDPESVPDVANKRSHLEQQYLDAGKLRFDENNHDIAGILPMLLRWKHELGAPVPVEVGRGLDEQILAFQRAALEDFARGNDIPGSMVVSGGPGSQNHWTEWLVSAQFFDSAVAPTMNRVTHLDMTETWLRPLLRMSGLDPARYRVGYDPSPVLVKSDQSAHALALHLAGLLNGDETLRAANFEPSERMDEAEFAQLLELLSRGASTTNIMGMPAEPATSDVATTEGPPPAPAPVSVASILAGALVGTNGNH